MNRQQLRNPSTVGQTTVERAVYHLIDALSYKTDPKDALRSVVIRLCDGDRNAKRDVPAILHGLSQTLTCLMDEADRVGHCYQEAVYDLEDHPGVLPHLREGAGHSESVPDSLAALPPACVAHVVKRHSNTSEDRKVFDRLRFDGELGLAQALEEELADMNAIAAENADAASNCLVVDAAIASSKPLPLVSLGQGEYRREIGGGA